MNASHNHDSSQPAREFSPGEEALIEKTAWKVAEQIEQRLKDHFALAIRLHMRECPTTQAVAETRSQARGALWAFRLVWAGVAFCLGILGGWLARRL